MESPAINDTLTFHLEKVVHAPQEVMEDFEGPLDLILFLLSRNKIEIHDLSISLLCRQFLSWIEAREALDMEVASEFVIMASHLVYLKSKNLLTVGEQQDEEVDELKLQLEEHLLEEERRKLEKARLFLEPRAENYRMLFTKPPELLEKSKIYEHKHSPFELLASLREITERSERRLPPPPEVFAGIVGKEPYPVSEKIIHIMQKLVRKGKILMSGIFRGTRTRSEAVAAFLAVLEMCRNRELDLTENAQEGIWLTLPSDKKGTESVSGL